MISGFLTSVISSLPDHASSISRNAFTLIIDFYHLHSGFFSSEAFDKRTNRVSTDVADKHARCYISEYRYLVRRSREGHEWIQQIMAYIVASITVFVNAPPLSAAKVRHCKRKDCLTFCSFAANENNRSCVFLASSCLNSPIRICFI